MLVIKRNKRVEPFDINKIDAAITKAFNAVNEPIDSDILDDIKDELYINNIVSVEELQDQIEKALMACDYYDVAKAFILYRHKQAELRALAGKKQFIKDYAKASNAATGSKYDANANVTEKNIVTLNGELFKGDVIKVNRAILTDKIRQLYGEDLAKEYIRQLESHELYKHDETSIMPYCVAITMYPFLLEGLQPIGGLSAKPKNLDSFCGMFVNLVFAISSQFAGAVATGEFLMYFVKNGVMIIGNVQKRWLINIEILIRLLNRSSNRLYIQSINQQLLVTSNQYSGISVILIRITLKVYLVSLYSPMELSRYGIL